MSKLSTRIEMILYILEQCKSDFQWYEAKLKDKEREENNILHTLEGVSTHDKCPPKYEERSKLATQLQDALIARRIAKDNIAINKPLIDFINSDKGKDMINKFKQTLGDVKKVEREQKDRIYIKRYTDKAPDDPVLNKNLDRLINEWKTNTRK